MFTKTHVETLEAELKRTLAAVADWKENQGKTYFIGNDTYPIATPKQNSALRRASLDLSRALSALRQA